VAPTVVRADTGTGATRGERVEAGIGMAEFDANVTRAVG
jgi:hypothetical protein